MFLVMVCYYVTVLKLLPTYVSCLGMLSCLEGCWCDHYSCSVITVEHIGILGRVPSPARVNLKQFSEQQ